MSQDPSRPLPPPGFDLLTHMAIIIDSIATNLQKNCLDRKSIQKFLRLYSSRTESDARLLYTARVSLQCVDHALFLAYAHMELVAWLVKNNYNLQSTSVKWYSFKKLLPRYQLPLFSIDSQTAELRSKLYTVEEKAEIVYADLQANDVRRVFPWKQIHRLITWKIPIPPTTVKYREVTVPSLSNRPPECMHTYDPKPVGFAKLKSTSVWKYYSSRHRSQAAA